MLLCVLDIVQYLFGPVQTGQDSISLTHNAIHCSGVKGPGYYITNIEWHTLCSFISHLLLDVTTLSGVQSDLSPSPSGGRACMGNPLASLAGVPALIGGNSFVILLYSTINVCHFTLFYKQCMSFICAGIGLPRLYLCGS